MLFMGDGKPTPTSSMTMGFMLQLMKLVLCYRRSLAPKSIVAAVFMAMKRTFLTDVRLQLHAGVMGAVNRHD